MSRRWSDEKLTDEQIGDLHPKQLVHVVVDQQFDYWYDPCGKSGYDFNRYLSKRSRRALGVLREKWNRERPGVMNAQMVRNSNDWEFLTDVMLASITSGGSMGGLAQVTLTRLKNLLWHGEIVEKTALDDIVDALGKETK